MAATAPIRRLYRSGALPADGIAQDVAFMPAGDRQDLYDLGWLRHISSAVLAAAKALRDDPGKSLTRESQKKA
jgi:hypothetical protein